MTHFQSDLLSAHWSWGTSWTLPWHFSAESSRLSLWRDSESGSPRPGASGASRCRPCLAAQTLSEQEEKRKLIKQILFYHKGKKLKFLPETHPEVSFQSIPSHGRTSPPSPPAWDTHADPAWVAHKSYTCKSKGKD